MTAYAVHENELEMLSYLNTQATVFLSVASALASFAFGIWTNAMFAESMTPVGELASTLAAPLLIALSLLFVWLGVFAIKRRQVTWTLVKRESSVGGGGGGGG